MKNTKELKTVLDDDMNGTSRSLMSCSGHWKYSEHRRKCFTSFRVHCSLPHPPPPPFAPLYTATILSFAHLHTLAWKIQTLQVTQGHAGPQGDGRGGGGNHNAAWCFVSHHLFSRPPAWQIRRWREASTQKRKQTIQQMAANHFIRHSRKRKHNLPSWLFQCKLKDRVKDRQVYLKWGYLHNSGV